MADTILTLNLSNAVHEIARAGPELDSALQSFSKQIRKQRTLGAQPRSSSRVQLPRLPLWRPVLPRLRLPPRLRTGIPATVLRTAGTPRQTRIGAELQAGVQHVADSIRARLLDLRKKLQGFHDGFAHFTEIVHLAALFLPGRSRR
jgi:hypothetical protein